MEQEKLESFAKWLEEFLWRWERSSVLSGEAAHAIVMVLEKLIEDDAKDQSNPLPEPKSFIRLLENFWGGSNESR